MLVDVPCVLKNNVYFINQDQVWYISIGLKLLNVLFRLSISFIILNLLDLIGLNEVNQKLQLQVLSYVFLASASLVGTLAISILYH